MYVMIIGMILNVGSVMNTPTISQEFTSMATCEIARKQITAQLGRLEPLINQCVKK
jgi:hypothetical protein